MGNIFTDLFSTRPAEEAARAKAAGFSNARTDANSALDTGLSTANPLYGRAYGDFSTLGGKFGAGQDAYNDATGVNGPEGATRAAGIYRSLPGYNAGREIGINDLERRAAARGDLGGGNTSADTIKFASDYDAGKYGNYVASLAPNLAGATAATGGGAGVLTGEAGANLGVAGQKAQFGYNAATGTGNANADAALAPYSASQNFWSALMGGASLATRAFGGGASGGGFGSPTSMNGGLTSPMSIPGYRSA
jgi:hypothetical protein